LPDSYIVVVNNSNSDILLNRKLANDGQPPVYNPFVDRFSQETSYDRNTIKAGLTKVFPDIFKVSYASNPAQTEWVMIYDRATVENTPWEEVRRNDRVLRRFRLTKDTLDRLDYVVRITYP
jgi:hypothetical protein